MYRPSGDISLALRASGIDSKTAMVVPRAAVAKETAMSRHMLFVFLCIESSGKQVSSLGYCSVREESDLRDSQASVMNTRGKAARHMAAPPSGWGKSLRASANQADDSQRQERQGARLGD